MANQRRLPILVLFPQGGCNCRCTICDYWRQDQHERLDAEEIERLVPSLRALGTEQVVLSGGEPLLHPEIGAICELLGAAGVSVTLLSNGLLLERRAAEVVPHCDELVLSLDGPAPVHDAIRGVAGAFARLGRGIAAARSLAPGISITARCTVHRANSDQLRSTARAARALGFDRLSFLAADLLRPAFNRGTDLSRLAGSTPDAADLERLARELDALEVDGASERSAGFIVEAPDKLRLRLLGYLSAAAGLGELPPVRCNAPHVSTVIEADGAVRPCFFLPALGNVREQPLEAILDGAPRARLLDELDPRTHATCRACICTLWRGPERGRDLTR
jgi:Fe-coproporphyrin III synthase